MVPNQEKEGSEDIDSIWNQYGKIFRSQCENNPRKRVYISDKQEQMRDFIKLMCFMGLLE